MLLEIDGVSKTDREREGRKEGRRLFCMVSFEEPKVRASGGRECP